MKKLYLTLPALLVAVTLFAGAQTSTTQPQTAPSQTTPPPKANSQSSSGQSGAQGQGTSIDDQLQLSPDQKQKISAIVDDEDKQMAAVRGDSSLSASQKMDKARQIHNDAVPKLRAVLTPQQLQKLATIQQKQQQEQNQAAPQH
jgi:periplasmic protein CpxP/Spy